MEIDEQLAEELLDISAELRNSSAYAVLQNVDLGRLLPDTFADSEHASQLTIDSIVKNIVNGGIETLALSVSQIKALIELLSNLIKAHHPTEADSKSCENESVINSVQIEATLRENLALVSQHPRYANIADKTLAEFWDKTWLPAPFEEMLTIQQLETMDLSVLFKKKMVSDTRIACIAKALEAARKSLDIHDLSVAQQTAHSEYSEPHVVPIAMHAESLEQQALHEFVTAHYHDLCCSHAVSFVDKLIQVVPSDHLLTLPQPTSIPKKLESKIRMELQRHFAPEDLEQAQHLLQGPGVSIRVLASCIMGSAQPFTAVSGFVAVVIARGLGAEPVDYKGKRNTRFWTVNPKLLGGVVETLDSNERKNRAGCLHLDPILHAWCRSHGGEGKRRTDKRKKLISQGRKRR